MIYNSMPRKKKESTATDIAIGGSIFTNVNNVRTEFLIVHKGNPDSNLYDASCDGVWLLMKDCYTATTWHHQAYNVYAISDANTLLNSTAQGGFLGKLEEDIQNIIKNVKIPYCIGNSSSTVNSGANGLPVKVFFLSAVEVGFRTSDIPTSYDLPVDGVKLAMFDEGIGTTAKAKRIAKMIVAQSYQATRWWLRSPTIWNDEDAYYVSIQGDGAFNGVSIAGYGYRPCFIIPYDTKLDANNNIVA